MSEEDLTQRVKQAAQGISPETKPDERRRFLGSLRERVYVRINNEETKKPKLTQLFLKHMADYRSYTVLINSQASNQSFLNQIETACGQHGINFTLINNETAKKGPKDSAILVVAKTAINRPRIEIQEVYPPAMPTTKLSAPKKKSFFERLFHKNQ